jgi:hypothetical protein
MEADIPHILIEEADGLMAVVSTMVLTVAPAVDPQHAEVVTTTVALADFAAAPVLPPLASIPIPTPAPCAEAVLHQAAEAVCVAAVDSPAAVAVCEVAEASLVVAAVCAAAEEAAEDADNIIVKSVKFKDKNSIYYEEIFLLGMYGSHCSRHAGTGDIRKC